MVIKSYVERRDEEIERILETEGNEVDSIYIVNLANELDRNSKLAENKHELGKAIDYNEKSCKLYQLFLDKTANMV